MHDLRSFTHLSLKYFATLPLHHQALQPFIDEITAPGGSFEMSEELVALDGSAAHHKGVSYRYFSGPAAPKVLPDLYARGREWADDVFITYNHENESVRMTYGESLSDADALANALVTEYGVQKGERVAVAMRNFPEWMVAFMGATTAGAMCLPVNALHALRP